MTQRTVVVTSLLLAVVIWAGAALIAQSPAGKIWLISPRDGQTVSGKVLVAAEGSGLPDVQYVIFGVDDERPLASNARPYTWSLDTGALSEGQHTLLVAAYGRYGLLATSKPITVTVRNAAVAPAPAPAANTPVKQAAPAYDIPVEHVPAITPTPMTLIASASGPMEVAEEDAPADLGPALISCPTENTLISPLPGPAAVQTALLQPLAPVAAVAEGPQPYNLCLVVNGKEAAFRPVLQGDLALVPFRGLLEAVGGSVAWQHALKQATAEAQGCRLVLTVGSRTAQVKGQPVQMPAVASLQRGRMYAPLRFCTQSLGLEVAWEDNGRISVAAPGTAIARAR